MAVNYLVCNPSTDNIGWTTTNPGTGPSTYFLAISTSGDVVSWKTGTEILSVSGAYSVLVCESTTDVISWLLH